MRLENHSDKPRGEQYNNDDDSKDDEDKPLYDNQNYWEPYVGIEIWKNKIREIVQRNEKWMVWEPNKKNYKTIFFKEDGDTLSVFLRDDGCLSITIQPRGIKKTKFHPHEFTKMLSICLSQREYLKNPRNLKNISK